MENTQRKAAEEALIEDLKRSTFGLSVPKKLAKMAESAITLAVYQTVENDDRSLQKDIKSRGIVLLKASTMMVVVELLSEVLKAEKNSKPEEVLGEIRSALATMVEAVEEQVIPAVDQIKNLIDLYKEKFPEAVDGIKDKAVDEFLKERADNEGRH